MAREGGEEQSAGMRPAREVVEEGSSSRMEGWLYLIRSNPLGLQYSRKRYFILEDNSLRCFRSVPSSDHEVPARSALIDSCIRVTDDGRENIHKSVLYIFTLYNASNHHDQLKLGARSSEEAARWIQTLMETALKCPQRDVNIVSCSRRGWRSFRLVRGRSSQMHSVDWTAFSSRHADPTAVDVIAPSPWAIFGCKDGLRLFKEAKEGDFHGKKWDDHPAIMAVGVVDANPETVFHTLMSLDQSRYEWDFCFLEGRIIERLDGHTDIVHKKLRSDWLPWGMKKRDLLLQRYWRREEDGTYVILYHSVFHQNCEAEKGCLRACLKSGGYVISPTNQGKRSVVKHMLAMDWKFWKAYVFPSSAKYITVKMLGRIAALREYFRAKLGNCPCSDFSSGELSRERTIARDEREGRYVEQPSVVSNKTVDSAEGSFRSPKDISSSCGSFLQLSDAADEFFDILDEPGPDQRETLGQCDDNLLSPDQRHTKLSAAAVFVKRLQELAAQKKGYYDLQDPVLENIFPCYGATLPRDPSFTMASSWAMTDPSTFLIRGKSYLLDHHKIKANNTLMEMVAADWIKSDKREDDLGGRPSGIVQKYASQGGAEFFFIVNIQVPGSTTYSLALYYIMDTPLEKVPLLENFVKGDDAFRNARFKLIPYISKGSWIVKQSVGKKACLVGQALEIHYFQGSNYLELGVDIGSSTVARGVVSLVLGYLNNLVIEMAFLIQGNTPDELPEFLLGTCRLNHLDASKAVPASGW